LNRLNQLSRREFTVADAYNFDTSSIRRWLISHIARYPWLPTASFVGSIISEGLFSVSAILIGQAFDVATSPQAASEQLLFVALLILLTYVIQGVFSIASAYSIETLAQRLERDSREELYISLMGKSQTFHNRQQVGDVMARATNDVQQLNFMINPAVSLLFDSLIGIIAPLAGILFLDTNLLLVPFIFLIGFAITLWIYVKDLTPVTKALRGQFGRMNARLAETIAGIEVVKAYAQELREKEIFTSNARRYRDLFVKEGEIRARYLPLLFYSLAYAISFGHAMYLYRAGVVSIGEVIAFMTLMGLLRFPTFMSLFTFALVQLGMASAGRILNLITDETEIDENVKGHTAPMQGEIAFENVSFSYDGVPVLKNLSFHAKPGETVAIVGQTGSGKTTLTRLVNRFFDATEGRVLVDGVDVREWSMQSLRSQISTIEQDIFLFSRTIAENIAFGARGEVTQEQIEQAARDAQAHDFILSFPDGYQTVVGERGVTLSGGQRQRIAIARAFLTNPCILVLDDSTSAIDSATEDQIQRAMRHILQGRTTLLITHRISQIRWADRILVLRRGELVAQGSHDDLITTSDAYRRIFARYTTDSEM
jgi:ATP-binding cassette subfamily B protein